MTQVCLLNSNRLSYLLRDALSWDESVSSFIVSAKNGSILAYAFRTTTPSIKAMRTLSTTMTAAYTVASEDILIFEAQNTSAISVIAPIADHLLLAVTGPEMGPDQLSVPTTNDEAEGVVDDREHNSLQGQDANGKEIDNQEQMRADLEAISQELASLLREELTGMKWPDDI